MCIVTCWCWLGTLSLCAPWRLPQTTSVTSNFSSELRTLRDRYTLGISNISISVKLSILHTLNGVTERDEQFPALGNTKLIVKHTPLGFEDVIDFSSNINAWYKWFHAARFNNTLKKSIKADHKLQNNNGRRETEKRSRSPNGHKLIVLTSELQVGGDSCLIWFCRRGDLIL